MAPVNESTRRASLPRTVLLVAADRMEFAGLLRHARVSHRLQWPLDYSAIADTGGSRLLMVANGEGAALAAEAAETAHEQERIDAVVSTGFCGALDPELRPGDILVATKVVEAASERYFEAAEPAATRKYRLGSVVSVNRVLLTAEEKARLRARGDDAVEMEAAALAGKAAEWRLPFYCIRVVTDTAKESFALDLNGARDADGRLRRWRIVAGALRRPGTGIAELVKLHRRSRLATGELGDFLAECEF